MKKILLVEDDRTLSEMLARHLAQNGYHATLAYTEEEAVTKVRNCIQITCTSFHPISLISKLNSIQGVQVIYIQFLRNLKFDLVLLDITLPDGNCIPDAQVDFDDSLLSCWLVQFSENDVAVSLTVHASSGKIWKASISMKESDRLPNEYSREELLETAFPFIDRGNMETVWLPFCADAVMELNRKTMEDKRMLQCRKQAGHQEQRSVRKTKRKYRMCSRR